MTNLLQVTKFTERATYVQDQKLLQKFAIFAIFSTVLFFIYLPLKANCYFCQISNNKTVKKLYRNTNLAKVTRITSLDNLSKNQGISS